MDCSAVARFGPFTFDRSRLVLVRADQPVSVGGRGTALLSALVEAQGQVVTRAELLEAAWPGQVVEERNLTVQIALLRKAMGNPPDEEDPIRTVSRVGYRLLLDVPLASPAKAPSVRPSVAILPFGNLSADSELSYFADGVTEDLITALSRFKSFAVIARNSSFAYRDSTVPVPEIARALGVRYIVEGSVRRSGKRVRVSARLTDATSEAQLWGETFEGALGDIFDMQDRITASIIGFVEPQISQAEMARARQKRPESLDAYDYFLRGLALVPSGDIQLWAEALALFDRAVELDPTFPQALAYAAFARELRRTFGGNIPPGIDDMAESIILSERALAVAGDDALVLALVGQQFHLLRDDGEGGLALVERAVTLNPHSHWVLNIAATVHLQRAHFDRAIELYQRALTLSPNSPYNFWGLAGIAHAHLNAGRFEDAIIWGTRSLTTHVPLAHNYVNLAVAYAMLDRLHEARLVLEEFQRHWPGVTIKELMDRLVPGVRRGEIYWEEGLRKAGLPER